MVLMGKISPAAQAALALLSFVHRSANRTIQMSEAWLSLRTTICSKLLLGCDFLSHGRHADPERSCRDGREQRDALLLTLCVFLEPLLGLQQQLTLVKWSLHPFICTFLLVNDSGIPAGWYRGYPTSTLSRRVTLGRRLVIFALSPESSLVSSGFLAPGCDATATKILINIRLPSLHDA